MGIALAGCFIGVEAAMAQSGPVLLTPPQKLQPPGQTETPEQAPVPSLPVPQLPEKLPTSTPSGAPIQINTLQTINPDTTGVLSADEGGFGVDMWSGTSKRMLTSMIGRLPVNIRSDVMRDLMRRLLLSTATLPDGMAGDGSYIASRVGLLSGMGDTDSVNHLLDATPGRASIEELVQFEADARFLSNDNARACALAASQIDNPDSIFWQKAFIFCQALNGEHDKASLGVSLLQETGDEDQAFYALVETLAGNPVPVESLADPTPMHLSMARVSKTQLPGDVIASNRPGVLRTIATSPNATIETRLEAAERAEMTGALSVDNLRQLYTSISFSEEDLANPLSKAESEGGPLSRALLYRASLIQTIPVAQAEAAAKALSLGRDGGRYTSTVRVFMPVLKRIPPSTELIWFAPDAIRAFLIGGEKEAATPWFSLLRNNALHNVESAIALNALLPMARLAGSSETHEWGPGELAKWWNQTRTEEGARDKAALLYTLLEGLGEDIPRDAWEALLEGPERKTMLMPNPSVWHSLKEATLAVESLPRNSENSTFAPTPTVETPAQGNMTQGVVVATTLASPMTASQPRTERVGEIVMLSLIALGEGGPAQAEPVVLEQIMRSLKLIGLENEVRELALEAAVAAGL